jgi:hypothetical protein
MPVAKERNAGVVGAPVVVNAEVALRKAICACAGLPRTIPASAPRSSKLRSIVRLAFISISP